MKLEEQIMNDKTKELANEIDFVILSDMLVAIGWSKVVLKPMVWEQGCEVDEWVANNIKGPFETMGLVWVFENQEDANWFSLRWLG